MPWQEQVIDVALEVDSDGSYHYDEVVLTVPRQSGKTALVLAMAVHRLVIVPKTLGRQRLTYTAQTRQKARLKLERDFADVLRDARPAFREVPHARAKPTKATEWRVSLNNGAENILFGAGNYLQIDAPSRTGGHGDTLDVGVIDEAFAHMDDTVETGMEPSMATRVNNQIVVLSTAGDAKSKYLWRKVLAGRKACDTGDHGRTAYFEWSAPDDADPGDPATWWSCSPALGITQPVRFLEGQWEKALRGGQEGVDKFRRSYLNQWPDIPVLDADLNHRIVPHGAWLDCERVGHKPTGAISYAVDADLNAKGETWVSVAASDGTHVELVTPAGISAGTAWVVEAVTQKRDRIDELIIDPSGPAGVLVAPLEKANIPLRKVKPQEMAQASGQFLEAIVDGTIRHVDQQPLNIAVAGADRRDVGDGAWKWSRKRSTVDISPLVACTLARWAAQAKRESAYLERGLTVL